MGVWRQCIVIALVGRVLHAMDAEPRKKADVCKIREKYSAECKELARELEVIQQRMQRIAELFAQEQERQEKEKKSRAELLAFVRRLKEAVVGIPSQE